MPTFGSKYGGGKTIAITTSGLRAALANQAVQKNGGKPRRQGVTKRNVQRIVGNPVGAQNQIRITKGEMGDLAAKYGGALSASIKKQYVVARKEGEEGVAVANSQAKQYARGKKTMAEVMGIYRSGQRSQAAAAAVAMSQQLQSQTNASDSQAAAFAADIMMAELQHDWAQEDAEASAALAWKYQKKALEYGQPDDRAAVQGILTTVPTTTTSVVDAMRGAIAAEGYEPKEGGNGFSNVNVSELSTQWANENGITDPNEIALFNRTAYNIKSGMGAMDATEAAVNQLFGQYEDQEWYQPAVNSATSTVQAAASESYAAYRTKAEEEEGGGLTDSWAFSAITNVLSPMTIIPRYGLEMLTGD